MKASFIFPPKKHAYFDLCKVPLFITFACSSPVLLFKRMFRPGGTPYNDLYRDAPPERDTFFMLQVYERVGILLVEVYERVGILVIWVCERAQKG